MSTDPAPKRQNFPWLTQTSVKAVPSTDLILAEVESFLYFLAIKTKSGEIVIACQDEDVAQESAAQASRCLALINDYWGNTQEGDPK